MEFSLFVLAIDSYACPVLIQFDVTFPALACSMLSLDAMDISGEEHLDVVCTIIRLNLVLEVKRMTLTSYYIIMLEITRLTFITLLVK